MNSLQNYELNNLLSLSVVSKHMLLYVNTQEKYIRRDWISLDTFNLPFQYIFNVNVEMKQIIQKTVEAIIKTVRVFISY